MSPLAAWILVFVVAGLCDVIFLWLLARRLRRVFPAMWKDLGRPKGCQPLSLGDTSKEKLAAGFANIELCHFVWRCTYTALRDRRISLFVWILRFSQVLTAVAFLLGYSLSRISN
jgi:hypothetical protein